MHYTVTCVDNFHPFQTKPRKMVFRFETCLQALAFEETQLDPDLRAWPWAEVKFEAWEHEVIECSYCSALVPKNDTGTVGMETSRCSACGGDL